MNFSVFGLGNVGSNVFNILSLKNKILTFSKNNRFNCLVKFNQNKYEKLFKFKNLFIELIGGISLSYEIIINCIITKNSFISANKDLLSKYLFFLFFFFKKINNYIYYEASVCGVLPIINLINNYYSKELFFYFIGILNGTCNYILTNINNNNFLKLIRLSIKKGFSEKKFNKDILGIDSLFKFSILISKINNYYISYFYIYIESIFNISKFMKKIFFNKKYLSFYLSLNNYIFLNISLFFTKNIFFKKSKNSYNIVIFNCKNSKKNTILSLGAGGEPTAASVISNYYNFFEKKTFFKKKCFKKKININKNFNCFNYIIKIKFNYNIFFYLFNLKIKFIKIYFNNYFVIKIKKTLYKKILFFLYFLKKKKYFLYKLL